MSTAPVDFAARTQDPMHGFWHDDLAHADPEIAAAVAKELARQRDKIELIASENIASRAVLEAAGASLSLVVKTTVFLADMNDFAVMNEVYATFFGATRPARSTVQAARLPRDVKVEIEVIALA